MGELPVDQDLRIKESCFGLNGSCIIDQIRFSDGSVRSLTVRQLERIYHDSKEPLLIYDSLLNDFTPISSIRKYPDPHDWILVRTFDGRSTLLAANTQILTADGFIQVWELTTNDVLITKAGNSSMAQKLDLGFLCQSSFCIDTVTRNFDCDTFSIRCR